MTGYKETIAIDVRLVNFITLSCPDLDNMTYEFAKELLMKTAKNLRVEPATLDFSIWTYMTNHKSAKISKINNQKSRKLTKCGMGNIQKVNYMDKPLE